MALFQARLKEKTLSLYTNPKCRLRKKKLYLNRQGIFSCRKCLSLAYSSQNQSPIDRLIEKKWNLIYKLNGTHDLIEVKPKGMHKTTFKRLQEKIFTLDDQITLGIANYANNLNYSFAQ